MKFEALLVIGVSYMVWKYECSLDYNFSNLWL